MTSDKAKTLRNGDVIEYNKHLAVILGEEDNGIRITWITDSSTTWLGFRDALVAWELCCYRPEATKALERCRFELATNFDCPSEQILGVYGAELKTDFAGMRTLLENLADFKNN